MKKLDMNNASGARQAQQLADRMVESIPFADRNHWLVSRGWENLGYNGKITRYTHPTLDHPLVRHNHWVNQIQAMNISVWQILHRKGIV